MQDREERLAADARVLALSGGVLWLIVISGVMVTLLFVLAQQQTSFMLTADPDTQAIQIDFRVFWAAGQLAWQGEPLAAFDMARLGAVHGIVVPDEWMPWLYPPGYLVLLMPFGAMSFPVSFLIATLLSIVLIGLAVRPFTAKSLPVWLAMTMAPAYIPALLLGQNSILWLAGLVAALAALRDKRWILAGVLIGCLTLKPQLGLLIPVALLAAGLWRTIFVAAATAIVLAAVPTLFFGVEYWPLMLDRMTQTGASVALSVEHLFLMVGTLRLFTLFGFSSGMAILMQWVVMLLSAVIVGILWRSKRVSFDAKAAGLLLAILLSAPYLWYYEVAMMAVIGLFLLRAGLLGDSVLQRGLLFCLWLGGALQTANTAFGFADEGMLGATLIMPVLLASMAILLFSAAATRHASVSEG